MILLSISQLKKYLTKIICKSNIRPLKQVKIFVFHPLYILTASVGNFSIFSQSTDGPDSSRKR